MTKTTYLLHINDDDYYFDSISEMKYFMIGKGLKPHVSISYITTTIDLTIVELYPFYN